MSLDAAALLPPRIAVVDDERQIHASLRLRLGKEYELVSFFDARHALDAVADGRFDLCLVDIHMPNMDGLTFIEAASKNDPALGHVVLSAFDSDENLRRAIPLQVYDFVSKPLPERDGFEARIPDWIARTRQRRRDQTLAQLAGAIDRDLNSALLEREVELIAAESARDALLQTANLLTTIHAHLVTASSLVAARAKTDPSIAPLLRSLEVGRKTAEAAAFVAEGFFDSAYGNRDSSPALLDPGITQAIGIACRMSRADELNKVVDCCAFDSRFPLRGLSGIDFLLMMVPALALAMGATKANSTVRIRGESIARLETVSREPRLKNHLWLNRRAALNSQPGVLLSLAADAQPFTRAQAEAWLRGEAAMHAAVSARGLVLGIQKCKGLLGVAVAPATRTIPACVGIARLKQVENHPTPPR